MGNNTISVLFCLSLEEIIIIIVIHFKLMGYEIQIKYLKLLIMIYKLCLTIYIAKCKILEIKNLVSIILSVKFNNPTFRYELQI